MKYTPEELKIIETIGPMLEAHEYVKAYNYISSASIISEKQKSKLEICVSFVVWGPENWRIGWVLTNSYPNRGYYFLACPKIIPWYLVHTGHIESYDPNLSEGSRALAEISIWEEMGFTLEEDSEFVADILQNARWDK